MSLQDESFPADELMDTLTLSPLPTIHCFQLPQLTSEKLHQQQEEKRQLLCATNSTSAATSIATATATTNSSSCSPASEQNLSAESPHHSEGQPLSSTSSKTSNKTSSKTSINDADAATTEGVSVRKCQPQHDRPPSKAGSYHDIHSEYTKRRFKHVASKVGEYIAHMKAEDMKRRRLAQFERHRSMPEALGSSGAPLLVSDEQNLAKLRFSTDELRRDGDALYECHSDDGEEGDIESAANTSAATSNTNGNSNNNNNSNNSNNNNSDGSHESSNETNASDSIDKQLYAQLLHEKERIQSYSEYLQTKLDEKMSENVRLKRNVDYLRIELTNCQDKLKQKERVNRLAAPSAVVRRAKATQTDQPKTPPPLLLLQPPHESYITPDTPDANNNKTLFDASTGNALKPAKTVATIQPLSLNFSNIGEQDSSEGSSEGNAVLRQRTNSTSLAQYKSNRKNNNRNNINHNANKQNTSNSRSSSGGDSAIDMESAETCSRSKFKSKLPRNSSRSRRSGGGGDKEDLFYFDKRSGFHSAAPPDQLTNADAGTAAATAAANYDENDENARNSDGRRKNKKLSSLRRRWLRLLGNCTRCSDRKNTLDNSALQTYTQIPLLEKSFESPCNNVR